ncbi:MAG: hypothetical protein KC547_20155 [Anaerolineae bacterium]|nr:hypothetical protein [Anaerolineae bacterium]
MAAVSVVDNDFISVTCDPDAKLVHHVVKKPIDARSLREALTAAIEAMKTYHATKWLSDDRLNGELDNEDAQWVFVEFPKLAIAAGWKYWGLVVPHEVMARGSLVDLVTDYSQKGVTARVFTATADAVAWLTAQPN